MHRGSKLARLGIWLVVAAMLGCPAGDDDDATGDDDDTDVPLDGFGEISGDCGVLDDSEWDAADPFLFRNAIDFGGLEFDEGLLTADGYLIWEAGNLNPGSLHSEIFAFEVLGRCELAALLETEDTVEYLDPGGKKTDVLTEIDARKVGVSVTRAFHWPPEDPYTLDEAVDLLTDKLGDIPVAAANAAPVDAWERSILSVVAYDSQYADEIETAWSLLDPSITLDTIVVLTVTDGEDEFIY